PSNARRTAAATARTSDHVLAQHESCTSGIAAPRLPSCDVRRRLLTRWYVMAGRAACGPSSGRPPTGKILVPTRADTSGEASRRWRTRISTSSAMASPPAGFVFNDVALRTPRMERGGVANQPPLTACQLVRKVPQLGHCCLRLGVQLLLRFRHWFPLAFAAACSTASRNTSPASCTAWAPTASSAGRSQGRAGILYVPVPWKFK